MWKPQHDSVISKRYVESTDIRSSAVGNKEVERFYVLSEI